MQPLFLPVLAAPTRAVSEPDSTSQNGGLVGKRLLPTLPELEYRERCKDGKEMHKPAAMVLSLTSHIQPSADSRPQEEECMETQLNGGRRLTEELIDSTESLLLREELGDFTSSRSYRNGSSGGVANCSPHGHSATNGSVPPSALCPVTSSKNEKKQKSVSGKGLTESCVAGGQLSRPDTLIRYSAPFWQGHTGMQ